MREPVNAKTEKNDVSAVFSSSSLEDEDLPALPSSHPKKKLLLVILSVLGGCIILLLGFVLFSRYASLYARTIRNLDFDYRLGEQSADTLLPTDTSTARSIAAQVEERSVTINAVAMIFDEQGRYSPTLTLYDYRTDDTESTLTMKTCAEFWLPVETTELKQNGNTCYTRSGSGDEWIQDDSLQIPDLYAYCFAVDEDEGFTLYQRYHSIIGDQIYLCELWLMEDRSGDEVIYNTLYRYYNGDTLCGVRLLPSYSTDMLVFEICEYHAE